MLVWHLFGWGEPSFLCCYELGLKSLRLVEVLEWRRSGVWGAMGCHAIARCDGCISIKAFTP